MPHIHLPEDMPGITAGFAFRPETAKPMRELAHILLHTAGNEGFPSADRELIASFVSSRNTCYFCQTSHGAAAAHLHLGGQDVVNAVCSDYQSAPISSKLKALLAIAEQVQTNGKRVTTALVDQAKAEGATDLDIHDTILIAAAFCMYNRYVDGLATWQPLDPDMYAQMGKRMAEQGYSSSEQRKAT
jgi:uncharacterized peroxidase-related enzyme